MRLFATCTHGLEDVSAAEVLDLTGACATPDVDKVFFAATWAQVCDLQVRARTLHKVHLLLARGAVGELEDCARVAREVDWAAHLAPGQTFGVRGIRHGTHPFTSVDVGRVVGREVQDSVERARGARPPVDLDDPGVEVVALVRGREVLVGLNLTGDSLHQRGYRVADHPAPLRPSLAAALVQHAGYAADEALWDPMCGSATILIEAAMRARGLAPNPARAFAMERLAAFPTDALAKAREAARAEATTRPLRLVGTERFEKHILGAARNAQAAGVWDAMHLRVLDATRARREDLPFAPDTVIVNPPYGLRIASKGVLRRLYRGFLQRTVELAPRQLLVLVGNRIFEDEARGLGLAPVEARDVIYGDLPARVLRFGFRDNAAASDHGGHKSVK